MNGPGQAAAGEAGVSVVTLPAEVDYANIEGVNQDLTAAFAPGVTTVIADFSGCTFCDTSGLREVVAAHKLAAARQVAFRLVVPSSLMRIFTLSGLRAVLSIFPNLGAALAGEMAGAEEPTG